MLAEALKNRIQIADLAQDWKKAIEIVIRPLQEDGCVEARYLDAIYDNVSVNGDYFIIMPGFAMPHTRSENGVLKNGLSFLKLRTPVVFSSGQEVSYLMGVAAANADDHIDLLAELADILMDDKAMEQLEQADSAEQILEIFR
ncbi:MAG: PTS sugar transporter subunit IIA [Lachnospiraceae bacterium]|nr:PTS sugar transporter subunit IIA [Lachnospiraceae bacterium]MDY4970334.1 PTS sugar transporter subunit IIA [Lachnospiraceae bacterium]